MQCKCGRPSVMQDNRPVYEGRCFECALQDPETNPYYRPVAPLEDRRAMFNKSRDKTR